MRFSYYCYYFTAVLIGIFISCSPKSTKDLTVKESSAIKEKMQVSDTAKKMSDKTDYAELSGKIPSDARLVQGKLSNGMHYYIQKNAKPESRAELRLAINAGSILEDEDQQGLAHFVEHMAFNGTENFDKNELVNYLETTGTRFGPDLNAFTSFDETVYMLQVRTDSTELFDKGMLIIRDWANGVTFDHEEIDKERGVVESEWRSRLSPDQRMQNKYFPVMYSGSQYAKRLPIGDPQIIKTAEYETFKRFYRDWYRPDLMAIVVVGDVDVSTVQTQIRTLFGDIAPVENPRERTKFNVPQHEETLVSIASDAEASFTNVRVMYKHEKKKDKTLRGYRKGLVRGLYNSMMSSRLEELTKSADPPFVFGNTSYGGDVGDLETYRSFAFVSEGKAKDALEALLTENQRVLQHGFTQGELDRAKERMQERAEKNYKEMDKTESNRLVMRYVYKYLDNIPTPGPKQTLDMYNAYMPVIKLEEINALPAQWIKDDSRVVVVTGPLKDDAPLPTEEEVRAILAKADGMEVEAYVDEVITEPFFDKKLNTVAVAETKKYDNVGLEYIKLDNGVEVYLKKTDFKNDEIIMSATSPGGSSLYSDDVYFDASNATAVVSEAGLGNFSSIQLDKLMSGKTVTVRPYIGTLSEGMNGSSSPDDMEIMFQMIHKYFYEPRIDKEAFTSFVTKQKGVYKNLMSNPQYYFSDYTSKVKFNNHPRMGFPSSEDWENMDYDRVMQFYRERFADASDFTFTFVGNFDDTKIKSYIQTYLGDLPSINREETWMDIGVRAVKGGVKDHIKNGVAPKTNVQMYYHGDFDYTRENNYVMSSMLAYLRIKLREKLREDLGGVYGVRVSGGGSKKPREEYSITVSFNSDPPMTDTLVQAAKAVIAKALAEGPSAEDMVKVKETQRQNRTKDLEQNRFWQRQIATEHDNDKEFDMILLDSYNKRVDALTAKQIQDAIGSYFNYDNYIEIIMAPEDKPMEP